MPQRVKPRLFTPRDANRTLPLVRKIVEDILSKSRQLRSLIVSSSPSAEDRDQVGILRDEINGCMAELEEIGCYYKSTDDDGIVDFPGSIDGELVWLCWKVDESTVRWYHGFEEGFSSLRLIPDRLLRTE